MRLEQQAGHGRAQGQRVERRDHGGNGNRQRELAIKLSCQPANKRNRHEHRNERQRNGNDGSADLAHGFVSSFFWGESIFNVAFHVFHDHDGIIHDDPNAEN